MEKKNRIYGCLVGAAYGDAMGAPTETRSQDQIFEKFGGFVTEFFDAPNDTFARGNKAGVITDDFSMSYVTIKQILKNKGDITDKVAVDSLIEWSKNPEYFEQFVGPTSREGINRLKNNETFSDDLLVHDNLRGSNGAAMKIGPISLFADGNFDEAMKIVETIAKPTHYNNKSMSGACAIAASVNQALSGVGNIDDVIEAGLKGALYGETKGTQLAGPSVYKRIKLALSIAQNSSTLDECMRTLSDVIGTNASAYETVPTVYGLIAFSSRNPLEAIHAAVNIGNDTDTIAAIIGSIVGSYWGADMFKEEDINFINDANKFSLEELSNEILTVLEER